MITQKKRDIVINAIEMVPLNGSNCIPTAVTYTKEGRVEVGFEAYEREGEPSKVCNNFKIRLGEQEPGLQNPKTILFKDGQHRSLHSITNDYLKCLVEQAECWVTSEGLIKAARVLVAEPVAIHEHGAIKGGWLANYRNHIRRILGPKFTDVDFLPEPFAVFQYYRYGYRHPLVAEKKKYIALVLDFGGGTFDVSVIETTIQGEISNSGRNCRPLAASSISVGGFFFNRKIAEYLLLKPYQGKSAPSSLQEALRKYDEKLRDPRARAEDFRQDFQNFFRNFENFLYEVEKAKTAICSKISDWSLEGQMSRHVGYHIRVPQNPLSPETEFVTLLLDAEELRKLFIDKLWQKFLYPAITNALVRAKSELEAQQISLILMSGGSSNIRWLHRLITQSNHRDLEDAQLLELQGDFQEIVAKGLAIECARKTYSHGDGDFRAVTYNRLCLALNPNGRGVEIKNFRPVTKGLSENDSPGVLLPSASILESYIDKPITWKFSLSHPPKRQLDYFFMSSSFDPEDTKNLLNVIDHTIYSTQPSGFDSRLQVELRVKEDGTTYPRFIYRAESPMAPEIGIEGRPFHIGMTFGGSSGSSEAYMGIDFGTSNSSISYVAKSHITSHVERAKDSTWQNISDLAYTLPYPISSPLSHYLSVMGAQDLKAIDVVEGFLMLGAYIAYSEYCVLKGRSEKKLFKEFSQRSAGPLWSLLRKTMEQIKKKGEFSRPLERLFEPPVYDEINSLVSAIADVKHGKAAVMPDFPRAIRVLGNIFEAYSSKFLFGYFEDVKKVPFRTSYEGLFRQAIGRHTPFLSVYSYEGGIAFSGEEAVLVSKQSGRVLLLTPLMFWARPLDTGAQVEPELYCYDIFDKGMYSYKWASGKNSVFLTDKIGFGPLIEELNAAREKDQSKEAVENIKIVKTHF